MKQYMLVGGEMSEALTGSWVRASEATAEVERLNGQYLRWTQQKPSEEGRYLRLNPPISHVIQVAVFVGLKPGVLVVPNPENPFNGIPVSELPDRFWWFGPIPSTERILEAVEATETQKENP